MDGFHPRPYALYPLDIGGIVGAEPEQTLTLRCLRLNERTRGAGANSRISGEVGSGGEWMGFTRDPTHYTPSISAAQWERSPNRP